MAEAIYGGEEVGGNCMDVRCALNDLCDQGDGWVLFIRFATLDLGTILRDISISRRGNARGVCTFSAGVVVVR